MESPETPRFRGILRWLDYRVSIGALIEVALWPVMLLLPADVCVR